MLKVAIAAMHGPVPFLEMSGYPRRIMNRRKAGNPSSARTETTGMKVPVFVIPEEITQESGGTCESDPCNYSVG